MCSFNTKITSLTTTKRWQESCEDKRAPLVQAKSILVPSLWLFMAMRTQQRKRVPLIIMLCMFGCIAPYSFTPVSGVKNPDDGDKEEIMALKAALAKASAQCRDLKDQIHGLKC